MSFAYCVKTDVETIFGAENIALWANLSGNDDAATVDARITRAMEDAQEDMSSKLRCGPYALPFAAPYPPIIVRVNAVLAGVFLYGPRRMLDMESAGTREIDYNARWAEEVLRELLSGRRKLDLTSTANTPTIAD